MYQNVILRCNFTQIASRKCHTSCGYMLLAVRHKAEDQKFRLTEGGQKKIHNVIFMRHVFACDMVSKFRLPMLWGSFLSIFLH